MAFKKSSNKILNNLLQLQGVVAVSVIGRDGFVIEEATNSELDLDLVGAVVSTGFGSSEVMAAELNLGNIKQTMIECELGKILIADCGDAILAVITDTNAVIGNIRHNIGKIIDELGTII